VDQEERTAAPEPIQPISVIPGSGGEKGSHKYQRSSSSGSDDYAYTQGNCFTLNTVFCEMRFQLDFATY